MPPAADILIWDALFSNLLRMIYCVLRNDLCQLIWKSFCMDHVKHFNQMQDLLRVNLYEVADPQKNDIRSLSFAAFDIRYGLF